MHFQGLPSVTFAPALVLSLPSPPASKRRIVRELFLSLWFDNAGLLASYSSSSGPHLAHDVRCAGKE